MVNFCYFGADITACLTWARFSHFLFLTVSPSLFLHSLCLWLPSSVYRCEAQPGKLMPMLICSLAPPNCDGYIKIYAKSYFSTEIKKSWLCGKRKTKMESQRAAYIFCYYLNEAGPQWAFNSTAHTLCVCVQLYICSRLVYVQLRQHGQQQKQQQQQQQGERESEREWEQKSDRKDNACTAWKMFVVNIFSLHR